jgi:hypothetical protein
MLPAQLPVVSAVEILILRDIDQYVSLDDARILKRVPRKLLEGQLAQAVADLFRQLPPGEPARCHMPPFGLQFYSEDGNQQICSICWQCNNIYGDFQYNFDSSALVSQQLFALLDRLTL